MTEAPLLIFLLTSQVWEKKLSAVPGALSYELQSPHWGRSTGLPPRSKRALCNVMASQLRVIP